MIKSATIWHNNKCSTSRKTLEYLHGKVEELIIRKYLDNAPSKDELKNVLRMMGNRPSYILRKKEKIFVEKYSSVPLTDDEILTAMVAYPILIERPIIIIGDKAFVARPFDDFAKEMEQLLD